MKNLSSFLILSLLLLVSFLDLYSVVIVDQENGLYEDTFTDTDGIDLDSIFIMTYEENALQVRRTTSFFATSQICYGVKEAGGSAYLLATEDNTTAEIYHLDTGALLSTIALPNKGDKGSYNFSGYPNGTPFKIVADKPVNASMINKAAGHPGATFYPAYDTQVPMGKEFYFEAPFSRNTGRIIAFNPNDIAVTMVVNNGDLGVHTIAANSSYSFDNHGSPLDNWNANQTMSVKTDYPVTIETISTGNCMSTVPATDDENSGKGSGTQFYFATDNSWPPDGPQDLKGAVIVYPYEDNISITLTQIYDDGTSSAIFTKSDLSPGDYYYYHGMDNNGTGDNSNSRFRLESSGIVEIWAGGVEFGGSYADTVQWMGDDMSYAGGRDLPDGSREYYLHSMTHNDFLLSSFDNMVVNMDTLDFNGVYQDYKDTTLNKDEWFSFGNYYDDGGSDEESYMARIVCSKPPFIMTSGGNQYNDWATNLPGMKLTTDNTSIYTQEVTPLYLKEWSEISFNDSLYNSTLIYYQIEYDNLGDWEIISDFDLPGNDTFDGNPFGFKGFNSRFIDSLNISLLDTAVFKSIRLHAQVGTSNKLDMRSNPRLNGWQVNWVAFGEPVINPLLIDQIVNIVDGESFSSFDLDDFVSDLDDPLADLSWSVSGNSNLFIDINSSTHLTTITNTDPDWFGSEDVIFAVTDPDGYFDKDTVEYTVVRQEIFVSNNDILFGDVRVDETSLDSLYIKNTGTDTLQISELSSLTAPFSLKPGTVTSFEVLPNDSLFVVFSFTPTTTNSYNKTLQITSNDSENGIISVFFSGRGVTQEISGDDNLLFGNISLNISKLDSIEISNIGNYPLQLTGFSGLDGVIFDYTGLTAYNIAAGSSVFIPINFRPQSTGVFSDTLFITNDDSNENPFPIRVVGVGVDPILSSADEETNFGSINIASFKRDTVTIKNIGSDSLIVSSFYGLIPPYEVVSTIGNLRLDNGEELKFVIDFDPSVTGFFTDTLKIISNDEDNSPFNMAMNGTGIYQEYFSYDTEIDFGTILKNEAVTDSVVIYNVGTDFLSLTDLIEPNLPFSYNSNLLMPQDIDLGDSISFKLTFTPSDTGSFVDTVKIISDDNNNLLNSYILRGRSITPFISGDSNLSFGKTEAGTTLIDSFVVRNTGNGDLTISGFTDPNNPFTRIRPAMSTIVSPMDSVYIVIGFSPSNEGAFLDSINVLNNDLNSFIVTLTGIGTEPSITGLQVYNFGEVLTGTVLDTLAQISSNGSGDLIITGLTGLNDPFTLTSPIIPPNITMVPGDDLDLEIVYSPNVIGSFIDTLVVMNNSSNYPSFEIVLTGTAIAPNIFAKTVLDFGNVAVNSTYPKELFIANTGNSILNVLGFLEPSSPFDLLDSDPLVILPNDSISVTIDFMPTTNTHFVDTLKILSNDPDEQLYSVVLTGDGVLPELSVVDTLHFLTVPGSSEEKNLVIKNTGSYDLTLSGIDYNIFYPFNLISSVSGFPITIAPQDSVESEIGFSPVDGGYYEDSILVYSDDPVAPLKNIIIYGIGDGPEYESNDSLDFGYIHIHLADKDTSGFYIKNLGTQNLDISSITGFTSNFVLLNTTIPLSIGVEDSTYFEIEFNPNDIVGFYETILTVNNNDFNEPAYEVKLTGYGYEGFGEIEIESAHQVINFGEVELLRDSLNSYIIKNIGDGPLLGYIHYYTENFKGESYEDSTHLSVLPFSEKEYSVRFIPTGATNYNSNLTIVSNDTTADSIYTFPFLTGTGIEPLPVYLPSDSIDFGEKRMYREHIASVSIQNNGSAELRITGLDGLLESSVFSLRNTIDSTFALGIGESREIEFNFYPSENLGYRDTVNYYYNHFDGTPIQLILKGTGKIPQPGLSFDNVSGNFVPFIDFGNVILNETAYEEIVIYNIGDSTLTGLFSPVIGNFSLELGKKDTGFGKDLIEFSVGENDSVVFIVGFTPDVLFQEELDSLEVQSDDPVLPEFITVQMRGVGVIDGASVVVQPDILDFEVFNVTDTQSLMLYVNNIGTIPLIGEVELPINSGYSIENNEIDIYIESGMIDSFLVTLTPDSVGIYDNSLSVNTNDVTNPSIVVPMLGRAISDGAAMIINADTLDFGETLVNHSKFLSFNIMNAGDEDLFYNILTLPNDPYLAFAQSGIDTLNSDENSNVMVRFLPSFTSDSFLDSMNITSSNSTINNDIMVYFKGSAIQADPFIYPDSLSFDTTFVNTARADSIIIDNLAGDTEFTCFIDTVNGFYLEDGYSGFFTVPAGVDSIVKIIFTPIIGNAFYSDSLHITSVTHPSFDEYISVRGYSLVPTPTLQITHTDFDYGDLLVGADSTFVLGIKNIGNGNLIGSLENFDLENFYFSEVGARLDRRKTGKLEGLTIDIESKSFTEFSLLEGDSVAYEVTFLPIIEDAFLDSIIVLSNSVILDSDSVIVGLAGSGYLNIEEPQMVYNPGIFEFDSVLVGSDSIASFFVTNVGGDTLRGSLENFSEVFEIVEAEKGKSFNIQYSSKVKSLKDLFEFELLGSDTVFFDVRFVPVFEEMELDSIVIVSNSIIGDTSIVQLSGIGYVDSVIYSDPILSIEPLLLEFDTLLVGSGSDRNFLVKNIGAENSMLEGYIYFYNEIYNVIEQFGSGSSTTSVTSSSTNSKENEFDENENLKTRSKITREFEFNDSLYFSIIGNDSITFITSFSPKEEGSFYDSLIVSSNDTTQIVDTGIILTGEVIESTILIEGDGEVLFGRVEIGEFKMDSLRIINGSDEDFIIYGIGGFETGLEEVFSSVNFVNGFTINSEDSINIEFEFEPILPTAYRDTVYLYYNEELTNYFEVVLVGTGVLEGSFTGNYLDISPMDYNYYNDFGVAELNESYMVEILFINPEDDDSLSVVGFDISYDGDFISVNEQTRKIGKKEDIEKKLTKTKDGKTVYYYYLSGGDSLTLEVTLTMNEKAMDAVNNDILFTQIEVFSDASSNPHQFISLYHQISDNPTGLNSFGLVSPSDESEFYSSGVKFEWEDNQDVSIADSVYYSLILFDMSDTGSDSITIDLPQGVTSYNTQSLLKVNRDYEWLVKARLGGVIRYSDDRWSFRVSQKGDVSPNPFTPDSPDPNYSRAKFDIYDNEENISVKMYTIGGKYVKKLQLERADGHWTAYWNGKDRYGDIVGPGVYLYQVYSGNNVLRNGLIGVAR